MKLKLLNGELAPFLNLISGTIASGKKARSVSRFKKILLAKFEAYSEEEREILKEYAVLDGNGEASIGEGGSINFIPEKKAEGIKALMEFRNEELVISLVEFEPNLANLISALEESEQKLTGGQMDVLDELLTKLEELGKDDENVNE